MSGDTDLARLDVAQVVDGEAVVDLERNGSCSRIRGDGRVLISGASKGSLVIGDAARAGQSQDARGRVVTSGDSVLSGKAQHIFGADEAAGNGNGCPGDVGTAGVGDRHRCRDRSGRKADGVGERRRFDVCQHRRSVQRHDNIASLNIAQVVVGEAVVDSEGDGSRCGRGIDNIGVGVGDAAERSLVIGDAADAG